MKNIIAPSLLAADFARLGECVKTAEEAGADHFHFDIMDGCFVPNISFGPAVVKALREKSHAFFDVHMMVSDPARYIEDFCKAGADMITIHQEAALHLDRCVEMIHGHGIKAGVALNPATPIEMLFPILSELDFVLIMSVNPGFGGQTLIPYTLDKIHALRLYASGSGFQNLRIGIDGGVNSENLSHVLASGADYVVAGSAIFLPFTDIAENYRKLLDIAEEN